MITLQQHIKLISSITREIDQALSAQQAGRHDEFLRLLSRANLRTCKALANLNTFILKPGIPISQMGLQRTSGQMTAYQLPSRLLALSVPEGARPVCL